MEIIDTRVSIAVQSPMTFETLDYIILDACTQIANRIHNKIKQQEQTKN